jgi:hypothetical protein
MTEKRVWFIAGESLGVDIATDEPSHIHIPRRRRVVRPGTAGSGAAWSASMPDGGHSAAPTESDANDTRGPWTALVLDAA